MINQNRAILDEMVKELMDKETLGPADLKRLFANVIMSPERPQWLSNPSRPVSDIPPVPIPEKLVHSITTIDTPSQPNAESNR